ncbi:MAG: hypothetical protein KAV00_04695 [Phycisphaerae bacterium]|nr:hypothetical protein [Phycisphaerae bacterium]
MMNYCRKTLVFSVIALFASVAVGVTPKVASESKGKVPSTIPVAKPEKIIKPGPRGPIGPDVPPSKAEKKLFANRIVVKSLTNKAVQLACDQASKSDKKSPPPVVFLPAGKYVFEKPVNVPAGVTIVGAGSKSHCVSRDMRKALFSVKTPNVRITRLRLEGPGKNRKLKDHSTGISVSGENVRIDHCGIFDLCRGINFSGGGGQIDHCHIHHCIRDGLGYGVSFYSGARVLMCDNDFGPCRHCLASNGALDWSSPKKLGKYVHKPHVRKTHWELVHNRFYGDETTDYHRHWVIDTHPGMDGTFVVENNIIENIRMGLGIRDGAGIIKGNLFRNFKGYKAVAIIITWGKHNGIVVKGTMPRDIDIFQNRFEKVPEKYRIGKAENVSIDGEIVPKTKTERKGPKTKIPRLKPMGK